MYRGGEKEEEEENHINMAQRPAPMSSLSPLVTQERVIAADSSTDSSSLELQPLPKQKKQNIFTRIYFRPYKELSVWEIVLRGSIALLVGAMVGAIIGVIVRFA